MSDLFPPTRTAALERLADFLPRAGRDYAARRNFDLGPGCHTAVSTLSPYLRCRLITEQDVIQAVLAKHSATAAEKFVQEVFWRTYWKGWLELRPSVWDQYLGDLNQQWNAVQTQSGLREQWEQACKGDTDIECFNKWAQELVNTGYLHNHARMWFASIWVFTLKLPWELGADFFLRHLLDGDPASNTLGWRWVAGIQTPGKTYLATTSNISKFTEGRFHPSWQLASEAPAVASEPAPPARTLPAAQEPTPGLRTGFVLHDEDLSPHFALDQLDIVQTAVLDPQVNFGPLKTAPMISKFRSAALDDTVTRWHERLGRTARACSAEALADWAKTHSFDQIVTPYAPVGPTAHVLRQFSRLCPDIPVVRRRRQYDEHAWPLATKGFFPFKKNIPTLLDTLGT